jgi:hypothetical protein
MHNPFNNQPEAASRQARPAPIDPMKTVYDGFVQIERDFAAHELALEGVHVWSALRQQVFQRTLVNSGMAKPSQTKKRLSRWKIAIAGPINFLWRNPLLRRGQADYLVMKWERLQKVGSEFQDAISRPVLADLPGNRTLRLDSADDLWQPGDGSFSLSPITFLARVASRILPAKASIAEAKCIARIEQAMRERLGVKVPLKAWFCRYARFFRCRGWFFEQVIRRWGIKTVFVVVYYGKPELIAAAKRAGARVIDLQHGLMSHGHLAYDVPEGINLHYRPDAILLFGDHWKRAARHAPGVKLIVGGAPHIRASIDSARQQARRARRLEVLFLSQPSICDQLLSFALAFSKLQGAPKVLYRPHPGDSVEAVTSAIRAANAMNIELVAGGGGARTLALQGEAKYQVGVYSTALLEGVAVGCNTFVAPMPGWAYMAQHVEAGHMRLVATPEELLDALNVKGAEAARVDDLVDDIFSLPRPGALGEVIRNA